MSEISSDEGPSEQILCDDLFKDEMPFKGVIISPSVVGLICLLALLKYVSIMHSFVCVCVCVCVCYEYVEWKGQAKNTYRNTYPNNMYINIRKESLTQFSQSVD